MVQARWCKCTRNLRLADLVAEWRKEVRAPFGAARSEISHTLGGKELTEAARRYLRVVASGKPAQYNLLIARLGSKPSSSEDQLCEILRMALYQLSLYRSGRPRAASMVHVENVPPALARLQAQMLDLARFAAGLPVGGNWPEGLGFAQVSPAELDIEIETMLLGGMATSA